MAPAVLRAVACASALGVSASALSMQEGGLPRPWPADLERWAHGPLFSENSSLYHASVKAVSGKNYNLTIAAFDTWVDQGVSGELNAGAGWETAHITQLCEEFKTHGEIGNFLDVGANIGTFTIPMADCLRHRGNRVIAVEGMPPIADHLAVGLLANDLQNVDMYNYAVGAPDDPKKVTMSLNPVNRGGSTVKGNKPFTEMGSDQLQDLFHPGKKEHKYAQKVTRGVRGAAHHWRPNTPVQSSDEGPHGRQGRHRGPRGPLHQGLPAAFLRVPPVHPDHRAYSGLA